MLVERAYSLPLSVLWEKPVRDDRRKRLAAKHDVPLPMKRYSHMTHFNRAQDEIMQNHTDQIKNLEGSLEVLRSRASELFESEEKASVFRALLDDAHRRLHAQTTPATGVSIPDATSEASASGRDMDELAQLVHLVVQLDDTIQEVRGAGDSVLDWIAKGGRSLGLD